MANKENQEALDILSNGLNEVWQGNNIILPKEIRDKYTALLQQAIDDLEIHKKALNIINKQFGRGYKDEYYLELARKELEND